MKVNKEITYAEAVHLLDADTINDMIYDDKEKGGPSRSLEQLVRDFVKSYGYVIKEVNNNA